MRRLAASGAASTASMLYFVALLYLLAFVAMTVLGTLIAVATPRQPGQGLRVLLYAVLALWALADFLSTLADTPAEVEALARVFAPVWAPMPFVALLAVLRYVGLPLGRRDVPLTMALALPAVGCVVLVETGALYREFVPAGVDGPFFHSRSTWWQVPVTAYVVLYFVASAVILLAASHRRGTQLRSTARLMALAVLPAVVVGATLNGALSPSGLDLPYLGSLIAAVVGTVVAVGILRSSYFAPVEAARRELDRTQRLVDRRTAVLGGLPVGVAIATGNDGRLRYCNPSFLDLLGPDAPPETVPEPVGRLVASGLRGEERELEVPGRDGRPALLRIGAHELSYSGEPALLITVRDVTAERTAAVELDEKREQLARAEKMEAMGRLAAGAAHDFGNQLATILGNADLLAERLPPESSNAADVEEIRRAAERARVMVRQLLAFGHRSAGNPEALDVARLVEDMKRGLGRILGPDIELRMRTAGVEAAVVADRAHLEQVLMTLATNARDAMPGGGRLTVDVRLERRPGAEHGEQVAVEVADSGCGMSEEVLGRVFEPFFTTKGSRGTGLGLATARGLLEAAGATLEVDSVVGKGSTFTIRLPRALAPEPSPDAASTPAPRPSATVLLVDDEPALVRLVRRRLERTGYRVVAALSGTEGLEILEATEPRIDLLLTDVTMPGMDGPELASRARELRPGLPVLLMSAHPGLDDGLGSARVATICKPFRLAALEASLAELLAESRPT